MAEYIDREAVCYQLAKQASIDGQPRAIRRARRIVADFPSADVVERPKGEWSCKFLDNFRKYKVTCTVCLAEYIGNYDAYDEPGDFNFCPNCGADMRGESDD